MAVIPVRDWAPDASDYGNPGGITVTNAVPGVNSYKPFNTLSTITNALDAYPRGAITAKDRDLNVFNYAGNETKLYSLSGTTWSDVSLGGGYSTGTEERWDMVRWKDKILATNFDDNPQQITMGAANFSNLTTALRCRTLAVVGDFVVTGNTFDGTDGNVSDRVRWSAQGDETDFTVSATTLSDFRDLNTGDQIKKIVGGEVGTIFCERSTFRMQFVGSPTIFQIDETLPGIGTIALGAVTQLGDKIYFWSETGLKELTGSTGLRDIGAGRVDSFVTSDLDQSFTYRISSAADPQSGNVFWAYPGAGNSSGTPNKLLVYNVVFDKWALIDLDIELIWRAAGVGFTLEQLDSINTNIDAMTVSLDDASYKGGAPSLGAFDATFNHGFFNGSKLTGVVETREFEPHAGRRSLLQSFWPLVDGGTITARFGYRNDLQTDPTYTTSLSQRSSGRFVAPGRGINSRFFRVELTVSGEWNDIIGIELDDSNARASGRRG